MFSTPERLLIALLATLLWNARSLSGAPLVDIGSLFSKDVEAEVVRWRAMGPVFEKATDAADAHFIALRPIYSSWSFPETDRAGADWLWPLAVTRRQGNETSWRALWCLGWDADRTDPGSRYRVWLMPFFFTGRDQQGQDYVALFPIGGTVREFFGRDEISFALFPLYSVSRLNDVETHNFLWPFISHTTGNGLRRFRLFPLFGWSTQEGVGAKRFVLWPFYTSAHYEAEGAAGEAYMLFPLFGRIRMENQDSWLLLPPFFRWDRSAKGKRSYCPWPFIQTASGETDRLYVWPLWGRQIEAHRESGFWLWPFGYHETRRSRREEVIRSRFFPFWYAERRAPISEAPAPATTSHRVVWPLLSNDQWGETNRLRVLDLWPMKNTPPVERNLAPLWTLYTRVKTPNAIRHEMLWGLYRWERSSSGRRVSLFPLWRMNNDSPDCSEWSILEGFAGGRRTPDGRSKRLLYFFHWQQSP